MDDGLTSLVGDLQSEMREVRSIDIAGSAGQRQVGRHTSGRDANIGCFVTRALVQGGGRGIVLLEQGRGRREARVQEGLPVDHRRGYGDDDGEEDGGTGQIE